MVVFWGAGLYRKCDFRIPDGETGCCPRIPDDRASYDKLSVVVIGLKESKSYPNEFIGMLNTLLSPEIPVTQKKSLLKEKYSMKNGKRIIPGG